MAAVAMSPYTNRIIQRLVSNGVPLEVLVQSQIGLVSFIKENRSLISAAVSSILPTEADIDELQRFFLIEFTAGLNISELKELFNESMLWLQWLIFEAEPHSIMSSLALKAANTRAVCGAVWGRNELAYRCHTCELDPTCAICVPCFQNGNHKDHDYSLIYTGNGCCDCGDVTAWNRLGFCSKHRGTEQIQPLDHELAKSAGLVLDALFVFWRDKMLVAENFESLKDAAKLGISEKYAVLLSYSIVEMLLDFCNCSESLLSFLSRRMFDCLGLLDVLMRAEFFDSHSVKKLHDLLLKLLCDPVFKYEFAKVFTRHYHLIIKAIVKRSSDPVLAKYTSLSTISVQIFTVPTLTLQLVREVNLLGVLLGCLTYLFGSCIGEDGLLQASKWAKFVNPTIRLVRDIRYVLSHEEVQKYIAYERPDISKTWLTLLTLVQGMDAQKRISGTLIEEENEHSYFPFMLVRSLGDIHSRMVAGAFSVSADKEDQRHSKGGKIFQESPAYILSWSDALVCVPEDTNLKLYTSHHHIPSPAFSLLFGCIKAIDGWLYLDDAQRNIFASDSASSSHNLAFRERLLWIKKVTDDEACMLSDTCLASSSPSNEPFSEKTSPVPVQMESVPDLEMFDILNKPGWHDIKYDVSSQSISFHIPLHQLLSLLLREAMKTYDGKFGARDKTGECSFPSATIVHDFFGEVLQGLEKYAFSCYMMEHPLRLRVFCAQVRAGMWRRNGNTEQSVQWYKHGLESDIFLLQCCAALAPPELFVKRIQERFGLSKYTSLNLFDWNKHVAFLVREMLILIIQIVKERRFSGLSTSDILKRDIACKLAVGDATHSQLVESLPKDLSKSDQVQKIIDMLALYSKPSGTKQGKYSLRKDYWKELDLYHPHWSYKDLQVLEDRYYQFCKVSALNVQLPQWRHVFEPLKPIANVATSKAVFCILHAVFAYAKYDEVSSKPPAPDGVLVTALHLLSLALDIYGSKRHNVIAHSDNEISSLYPDIQSGGSVLQHSKDSDYIAAYALEKFDISASGDSYFYKKESILSLLLLLARKYEKENENDYSEEARQCNIKLLIHSLLKKFAELSNECLLFLQEIAPELVSNTLQISPTDVLHSSELTSNANRKAKARERQAAIMEKMRAQQSSFIDGLKTTLDPEANALASQEEELNRENSDPEEAVPVCALCRDPHLQNPLCYLILLQKSRMTTLVDRGPQTREIASEVSDLPSTRAGGFGSRYDADSSNQVELVQDVGLGFSFHTELSEADKSFDSSEQVTHRENFRVPSAFSGAAIPSSHEMLEDIIYHSILGDLNNTQIHLNAPNENVAHLLREKIQNHSIADGAEHFMDVSSRRTTTTSKSIFFGPVDFDGVHISSCGHVVHQECHDRYLQSLKQRHHNRIVFEGGHIVNPNLGELLCPVCRKFANSILPAFPVVSDETFRRRTPLVSIEESSKIPKASSESCNLNLNLALSLLQITTKLLGEDATLTLLSGKINNSIYPALQPVLNKLYMLYYPGNQHILLASNTFSQSLILWDTLRYSLISTEIAARGKTTSYPVRSRSCMESLSSELHASTGCILVLLLHVAQAARSSTHFDVLLRFRGFQLFFKSILLGASFGNSLSDLEKLEGILPIAKLAEKGESSPDVQFLKQAGDVVLTQDPFSSLMWLLFCLPLPVIMSSELFIAVVHLFYVVCVVQSMIACYNKESYDMSSFGGYPLSDVCKAMAGSEVARKLFVATSIDSVSEPKEVIRKLTYPYLRRCALLWNLLTSSTLVPSYRSPVFGKHLLHKKNDELDAGDYSRADIHEIIELENMFKICSLEFILKDKVAHALSLRWCYHFCCKKFSVYNYRGILSCSPAVPFKLIELPRIYEELLHRYIKLGCSNCHTVLEEPALCLLCGKLCSSNWRPCCSLSRCDEHALACSAGIGVYLLVTKTTILLQRSARRTFWPSLYLDAFGEEDIDLRRGRPLFLNEERYAVLTYLVASHGLDQSSEVLRQTIVDPDDFN